VANPSRVAAPDPVVARESPIDPATVADPAPPPTGLRRIGAALTYRDFRVLWTGAFVSTIGTWMQKVAQNWLVLTLSGSASAFFLGLDSFLGELPILLFTLIGGVIADRRDRRQLLLTSQYIQMTTAFTLAALVYFDAVRIWHVLMLSVITGLAQAFGDPVAQRFVVRQARLELGGLGGGHLPGDIPEDPPAAGFGVVGAPVVGGVLVRVHWSFGFFASVGR
jgi:MFS family permease